jgi:probable addiction module antidote protein
MKKAKAKENVKENVKAKVTYAPFEVADYLDSEEAIAEYLSLAARDENPGVLLKALGDVAKARGMTEVAKASGLGRESLYKTLAPGAKPRFRNDCHHHAGAECRVFSRKQVASASEEGSQVESSVGGERGCDNQSLHLFQQLPRFPQQHLNLPSLGECTPGEQAVLARVPVCCWRAGSRCATVHAAARFAAHRRRAARAAAAGFGATTWACQHRAGIAGVIAHACAYRSASAESRLRRERPAFGAFRAADAGFLSDTITFACCVTLPTMALPPSPTDTFCTVMAGSPWLR